MTMRQMYHMNWALEGKLLGAVGHRQHPARSGAGTRVWGGLNEVHVAKARCRYNSILGLIRVPRAGGGRAGTRESSDGITQGMRTYIHIGEMRHAWGHVCHQQRLSTAIGGPERVQPEESVWQGEKAGSGQGAAWYSWCQPRGTRHRHHSWYMR